MSFKRLRFISTHQVSNQLLHCLYTTIRYRDKKEDNSSEAFQIWKDGRFINIVMAEENIENLVEKFCFNHEGTTIVVKFLEKKEVESIDIELGDYIYIRGIFSYAYKYYESKNKFKLSCPITMEGKFKQGYIKNRVDKRSEKEQISIKDMTMQYLEKSTGLGFKKVYEEDRSKIRFERLFEDEKLVYDTIKKDSDINRKILFKNIISLDAKLPVCDVEAVKKLLTHSIGQKKSYGFGKLFIEKIGKNKDEQTI